MVKKDTMIIICSRVWHNLDILHNKLGSIYRPAMNTLPQVVDIVGVLRKVGGDGEATS